MSLNRLAVALFTLSITTIACGGGGSAPGPAGGGAPTASNDAASLDKNNYPVFPNPDAGADPAVSAEEGGKGFKGEGWETNSGFDLIGDPRAVKGGVLRYWMLSFPGTLRMAGPEWNTTTNATIWEMVYEPLLNLHPTTLEYVPALATHWQVSADKMTYRFRIDPNARFSDGTPVTADDVVATWTFLTDKTLQDLYFNTEYAKLEKPVAESKYIVRIKAKKLEWSSLYTAAHMHIFPAHLLKGIDGAAYLRDYNFKLLPGSGPYIVNESDIKKGVSISLRRRNDYWKAGYRSAVGMFNFDEYRQTVIRDQNLAFEMFKRGDLDFYYVNISRQWVEETNFENVQRGLVLKRKVFNNKPPNTQYLVFNTRRKPWDDVRVREAFALLLNREQLIEQLFFKEYLPINSYFPGTKYENPNNPKNEFNPDRAIQLLAEAGWKDRDAQGRLVKDGKPLQIELMYDDKGSERWLTVYQNDLKKAGITFNLRLLNPETRFKMTMQRQFDLTFQQWAWDNLFPILRAEVHSESADVLNSSNISGFKNKQLDAILEKYEVNFDPASRPAQLREMDGILMSEHHYIMQWYPPASVRMILWNRFGMPQGTLSASGDYEGYLSPGIPQLWWIDSAKNQKLDQALRDKSIKLESPPMEDRYWQEYAKTHP